LARPLIVVAFLFQRLGDAAALVALSEATGSETLLRGMAIGGLVCSTVLAIGVWRRLRWARYVLTTLSTLYVFGMSFAGLRSWEAYTLEQMDPRSLPLVSAAFYLLATAIMVRSRRVRHFANR